MTGRDDFFVVPELERKIKDEELELEDLIINEKEVPENIILKALCVGTKAKKGTVSRASTPIIRAFNWVLGQYREARSNVPESVRNRYMRDEEKPFEIHPIRTGIILKEHGCSPEEIIAGLLHDLPEDLAKTPEQMFDVLHNIQKEFNYQTRAYAFASTNKHKLILKDLERKKLYDVKDIRKELNRYLRKGEKKRYIFRYPARTLLRELKKMEMSGEDHGDIPYNLKKLAYPKYLRNSETYIKKVVKLYEEKKKNVKVNLLVVPKVKLADRVDNTRTVWYRKMGKQKDVFVRNDELTSMYLRASKRHRKNEIFDSGYDMLAKRLVYESLDQLRSQTNTLADMKSVETMRALAEYTEIFNKLAREKGKMVYEKGQNYGRKA